MDQLFDDLPPFMPALSDAFESNDVFADAAVITEGTYTITGGQVDWYQFESSAGVMEFVMTPDSEPPNLNMTLYDDQGTALRANFQASGAETITHTASVSGTYYLQVFTAQFGDNPPAGTDLNYVLEVDLPQVVDPDGNDTFGTAQTITEGSRDVLGQSADWYEFESPEGYMSLTLQAKELLDDSRDTRDDIRNLNMELYNSAGQAIKADFTTGNPETITFLAETSGTYYVKVFDAQFVDNPPEHVLLSYSLDLDLADVVADDGNDSFARADTITEGTMTVTGTGGDWYEFDTLSGLMNFTMTPTNDAPDGEPFNLNMELFDSDGNSIGGAPQSGNTAEEYSFLAGEDGTYFLRVFWAPYPDGIDNVEYSYTLNLDLPSANAAEDNDDFASAETLPEGTSSHTGTDVDWYRFDTTSGLMNFNLTPSTSAAPGSGMTTPLNLNMELFDANGNSIGANTESGATPEDYSFLAGAPGTYFLKVFWAPFPNGAPNGVEMSYDLTLDLPEAGGSEDNDERSGATELTEGTHTGLSGTHVDWYEFDTLSGLMNFTLTPSGDPVPGSPSTDPMNLNMELFDSAGVLIGGNLLEGAAVEEYSFLATSDDTYFLKVYWAPFPDGAPAGVPMTYGLSLDLPEADAAEDNDERSGATILTEGPHAGLSGTNVDWYRFDTLSGELDLTMTPSTSAAAGSGTTEPLNLNMELFDSAGNLVGGGLEEGTTVENFKYIAAVDDTYFLKVYWAPSPDGAPNGVEMTYDLDLTLPVATVRGPNDPGETMATATAIGEETRTVTGTGLDWFKFETGPGVMNFTMTPTAEDGEEPLNLSLEIYDENGVLAGNFNDSGPEELSFLSGKGGAYFLKVSWAEYRLGTPNGFEMTYTLDVDLPDNTWAIPLDFGPVRTASVAVYDIDNDGKDEIFIGTSKALDDEGNEVRPGGLIVMEDDGTVKWTHTFAASPGIDPKTGKSYQTTAVTTAPTFSDVNGDGKIDIVVGVGADNRDGFDSVGQPGNMGGVYALDADGNELWFHQTRDTFGDDNRSDGVYGPARVFDIDGDGVREVLYTAWDHYFYVLDGRTGAVEYDVNLHDTAGATPAVADLNNDGFYELIVPSDVTNNDAAGLDDQGGILHVLSGYGQPNVDGWTDQVQDTTNVDFRGKFEAQSLWSSAQIVDLNKDGVVEIVLGTGDFFQTDAGSFVKVWNADGTLRHQLPTIGRTLAPPLIADLDGDGSMEIIATTVAGWIHAWNASGTELFRTQVIPFGSDASEVLAIPRPPTAVDLDNDGDLELLVSVGSQMIALDSDGTQLTGLIQAENPFASYAGSPVAKDIDGDGVLDLITGGTNADHDQAIIYRWENVVPDVTADSYRTASYQDHQSLNQIQDFVDRFYTTILGREADAGGRNDWTDKLYSGVRAGADVATGFIFSQEYINQNTSDTDFVNTLYSAFFGRAADSGGFNNWITLMQGGTERADVLAGFVGSQEFINLANSYGIRPEAKYTSYSTETTLTGSGAEPDVLRTGAGDNILFDEGTTVIEDNPLEKDYFGQIYRLYGATLDRIPDAGGFLGWVDALTSGRIEVVQTAGGFVGSTEFSNTYGQLNDTDFVSLLYQNVLGRDADAGGLAFWEGKLAGTTTRAEVVLGFSDSTEYRNNTDLLMNSFMRSIEPRWTDVLEGGAGDDQMNGDTGSDIFIFRRGQGGTDTIHGFEPWDTLQLSGFGFATSADALAQMTQTGTDVVFDFGGQTINFLSTTMAEMRRVRYNLS